MEMVDIENAKEGMIINELLDEQGKVLLKKGTILTKDLIVKLKSLGISGVYVDNAESNDSTDNISPEALAELKELEYKFSDVRGNEIMEELMSAAKEYIIKKEGGNDTY
jgi:hypothetical protein